MMRNTELQETILLTWLVENLRGRLGEGWSVDWKRQPRPSESPGTSNALATLRAPDGSTATLLLDATSKASPSAVQATARLREQLPPSQRLESRAILVAPYLGPRVRDECRRLGVAYADQTGAWSLRLDRPSIAWELAGAPENPNPEARGLTSLRGRSTARVLRTLVDYRPPFTLRELAELARVTPATAYKVLVLLEGEGVVEREPRGAVLSVDWRGLLTRWARDYDLERQNAVRRCLAPRGIMKSIEKLRGASGSDAGPGFQWAITGAWAARSEFDSLEGARLVLYTNQPARLEQLLDLRLMQGPGSNVLVTTPRDERIFEDTVRRDGLFYAPWSQVAIDLLGGADREPSAGENLLSWMELNEDRWRATRRAIRNAP